MDSQDREEVFLKELENLINKYSVENSLNTPDWILANYLRNCLIAWEEAIQQRENWYGRGPQFSSFPNTCDCSECLKDKGE